MQSGMTRRSCCCTQPTNLRFEQDVQVPASKGKKINVGSRAIVDTMVLTFIPDETMDDVELHVNQWTPEEERRDRILDLYWSPHTTRNSLIVFLGEFKKGSHERNRSQLLLDFCTAQYQRYALGLPNAIIWGVTCAMGKFEVYSSMWDDNQSVSSPIQIPHPPGSFWTSSFIGPCMKPGT